MTLLHRSVGLRPNVFPFTLLLAALPLAALAIYATRAQAVGPAYLLFLTLQPVSPD